MSGYATRRALSELIFDLADSIQTGRPGIAVQAVSAEFNLPVEMRFAADVSGPVILADFAPTRSRTAFDPPFGRLALTLVRGGPG